MKTTRVTAVPSLDGSMEVKLASVLRSSIRRAASISSLEVWLDGFAVCCIVISCMFGRLLDGTIAVGRFARSIEAGAGSSLCR